MSITTQELFIQLPISSIHDDNEFNCRGKVMLIDVADLVQSIRDYGLQQPVVVRKYDDKKKAETGFDWGLVAGYRRFTACKALGHSKIAAKIQYDIDDTNARILNLQENLIRKDLDILQEAKAIEKLKIAGVTMAEIAQKLNVSIGWVQVRFAVLNFPESIQQECAKGILSQPQIKAISSLPRDKQAEAVKKIKDKRIRGEKGMEVSRPTNSYSKRARTRAEINKLLEHIYSELEPSLTTRALAWCVGNISSAELFNDIRDEAEKMGRYYTIPKEEL